MVWAELGPRKECRPRPMNQLRGGCRARHDINVPAIKHDSMSRRGRYEEAECRSLFTSARQQNAGLDIVQLGGREAPTWDREVRGSDVTQCRPWTLASHHLCVKLPLNEGAASANVFLVDKGFRRDCPNLWPERSEVERGER